MLSVALNFDREISPLYVEIFSLRKTKILAEEIKVEKLLLIHEAVMGNLSLKKKDMQQKGAVPAYLIFVIFYTDQISGEKHLHPETHK